MASDEFFTLHYKVRFRGIDNMPEHVRADVKKSLMDDLKHQAFHKISPKMVAVHCRDNKHDVVTKIIKVHGDG